jgi:hypothetical protein
MTDIISELLSRAPRYHIKSDSDLCVTIEKEDASDAIEAMLVNISVNGAKFKVSRAISAKEVLAVTIHAKRLNRTIVVSGEVCWVRPTTGDDWWLGCSLDPQIPEELLRELSEDGTIERREHQREQVSLHTTVQWELNNETASAWILNYSRGGFCLLSQFAGKPGERVRFQLELDGQQVILVRGKTQWVVKSQEGFVIGCEFLEPGDYNVMCDLAASREPDKGTSPGGRRHWLARWLGLDGLSGRQSNRQSLLRRSCIIAASAAVLCIAVYHSFLSSPTETQRSVDQRDNLSDSLAARSDVIQLQNANAGRLQQDAIQAVRPAVTGASRFSAGVDEPLERIRPYASVAENDNDRAACTPQAVPSEREVAESRTRAASLPASSRTPTRVPRLPTDPGTWPIKSARAQTPITSSEMRPGASPRQLANNRPPVRKTVNAEVLWDEIDSKPVEIPGPRSYRTWVDNTGRFRVVARFVNLEGDIVRLRTENGKYKVIPLDRLSQHDVRYVRHRFSAVNHSTAPE